MTPRDRFGGGTAGRALVTIGTLMLLAGQCAAAGPIDPPGSTLAHEAVELCRRAEALPTDERIAALGRGLAIAEQATHLRPDDPVAHFAAFCHRGRRLELQGLSWRILSELTAARRALERALELAPDYADALAAKGALLLRLPHVLGGNRDEGERLLRRAMTLAPDRPDARRLLGELVPEAPPLAAAVTAGRCN